MLDRTINLIIFIVTTTTTIAGCKLGSEHCIGDCDLLTAGPQTTEPAMTTAESMSSTTQTNSTGATTEPGGATTTAGTTETDGATVGMTEPGGTTTEGATETDGTTTEGASETEGPPVCPCILDDVPLISDTPSQPICGEELCPTVEFVPWDLFCSIPKGEQVGLVNPEALTCALTALRDRTPGVVRWDCGGDGGAYQDIGYVLISADGTAIRRDWGWQDLGYSVSNALQGALPDPGVFEQCLADGDYATRLDCLRDFMLGEPLLVCDEGWNHVSD